MTSLTLVRRIRARPQIVLMQSRPPRESRNDGVPTPGQCWRRRPIRASRGRYRVRFRMLDSTEHESSGEFLGASRTELALERRRGTGGSRIEITLKAVPEGTGLTFVHSRLHDEETRRSHEAGWTGSLDKLEAHFAAGTAA